MNLNDRTCDTRETTGVFVLESFSVHTRSARERLAENNLILWNICSKYLWTALKRWHRCTKTVLYTQAKFALKLISVISPAKAFIFMKQFGSCVNIVPQIQIFRGTWGQGLLGFPSQQLKSEGSGNSQIIRARSTPTILLPFHPHRCFTAFVLLSFLSLSLSFSPSTVMLILPVIRRAQLNVRFISLVKQTQQQREK